MDAASMETVAVPPKSTEFGTFDVRLLERRSWRQRLLFAFLLYPYFQWLLDLVRALSPVLRLPGTGLTLILRHDHVRQVLSNSRHFPVPWGWKMELVTRDAKTKLGGRNFVLGMKEADASYRDDYALLARAFAYGDVKETVGRLSTEATEAIMNDWAQHGGGAPFDIVEKMVLGVPAKLCDTYYGIPISEPVYLGKCTLAISSFLFGPDFDPPTDSADRSMQMALQASVPLQRAIRSAMSACRQPPSGAVRTPLQRLMQQTGPSAVDLDRVHAQLFGMVMGFIPTNVLAAGNLLETLLRHPEFMSRTVQAARAGDDDRLWRYLREALRFRNINLGPLRRCAVDFDLANTGAHSRRIAAGTKVLACTQSAMFDGRRILHPHRFDSRRPDEDYLVFGVGQHWCVGTYIAMAQITQMFKYLFVHYDVRRVAGPAGRMRRFNGFPLHQLVQLSAR